MAYCVLRVCFFPVSLFASMASLRWRSKNQIKRRSSNDRDWMDLSGEGPNSLFRTTSGDESLDPYDSIRRSAYQALVASEDDERHDSFSFDRKPDRLAADRDEFGKEIFTTKDNESITEVEPLHVPKTARPASLTCPELHKTGDECCFCAARDDLLICWPKGYFDNLDRTHDLLRLQSPRMPRIQTCPRAKEILTDAAFLADFRVKSDREQIEVYNEFAQRSQDALRRLRGMINPLATAALFQPRVVSRMVAPEGGDGAAVRRSPRSLAKRPRDFKRLFKFRSVDDFHPQKKRSMFFR